MWQCRSDVKSTHNGGTADEHKNDENKDTLDEGGDVVLARMESASANTPLCECPYATT